ncbi:MAG TPA: hypothetical protein VJ572_06155 [Azonexus sp.]|nr:hypothetical protein [Azonexus sp.]
MPSDNFCPSSPEASSAFLPRGLFPFPPRVADDALVATRGK